VNPLLQAALSVGLVALLLALIHVPLGTWMYRSFTDTRHWRVERAVYRLVGVDADTEQRWTAYALSVLALAAVSVAVLFALLVAQPWLPLSQGRSMDWHTAFDTAVSFTTNTNWQSYAGESGTGYLVQMAGLTVQNFLSAATGLAVAVAVVRGLARTGSDRLGNFWVDLTRATVRVLLPLAAVLALVLLAGGVIQNLTDPHTIATIAGGHQVLQGGPVASQEAIKELGTNGGGFFNANSSHPFENPNPITDVLEIVMLLAIGFALPRTYGLMVGDRRQGLMVTAVMGVLLLGSIALTTWAEVSAAAGATGSMEGKEQRFGPVWSSIFAASTTGTSTGAVNSMHESYSALGGGVLASNMLLGEVSPGGVGTGLYGMVVLIVIAVFIAGLMVGRTPELLGKSIGRVEITYAALSILVMPALVLAFAGISLVLPVSRDALLASGPHGLTEMLYDVASASNNNGSAFAGLSADQPYLNVVLAVAMFLGRFAPIVLTLGLAGSLGRQGHRPVTAGTMPTHTPLFSGMLTGVVLIVAGLTFFPALALGPLAEALS